MASLLDLMVGRNPLAQTLLGGGGGGGTAPRPRLQPPPTADASIPLGMGGGGGGGPTPTLNLPTDPRLQPLPARSSAPGGIGGVLSQMVGGNDDPRLSAEQNAEIRRNSLINAGLATLASGGGDAQGFQRLAQAMLQSRQFGLAERARVLQETLAAREGVHEAQTNAAMRDFRKQVMDNFDVSDPTERARAMSVMLSQNDFEGANTLLEYEKAFPTHEIAKQGDTVIGVFNPRTGEIAQVEGLPEPPADTQYVSDGRYAGIVDLQTGEWIARRDTWEDGLSPAEQAAIASRRMGDMVTNANTLRGDWRADTNSIREAIQGVEAALAGAGPDGEIANDQAVVIAFNKLLDANSAVLTSEAERTIDFGGLRAKVQTWMSQLVDGRLPDTIKQSLVNESNRLLAIRRGHLAEVDDYYRNLAQSYGIEPEWVVRPGASGGGRNRIRDAFRSEYEGGG